MPSAALEVRQLARTYTAEAITRLADWMRSANAKASVAAAQTLLDRGWGKAVATIETGPTGGNPGSPLDLSKLDRDDFLKFRELCMKAQREPTT